MYNMPSMKAVIATGYGAPNVLKVRSIQRPVPKSNEILIKVKATTVTAADTMMRRAEPYISRFFLGFSKPKIPVMGTGFAGVVESVGEHVLAFRKGDEVFGETGVNFSANAEYLVVPMEGVVAMKPANLSFTEAATLCDGPLTSMNFLREVSRVRSGQRVLINGASGSLGTAAVQIAKFYGAEVTGVCGPSNMGLVRSLEADRVIDYTATDFTNTGEQYDIIFDSVGKSSFGLAKRALKPKGMYLSPVLSVGLLFSMMLTSMFGGKQAKFSATGFRPADELKELLEELFLIIESQKIRVIIDKSYSLDQAAEAHRYVDTGHKRGNVVLKVS
jgi:NADPH:quinone reductase-like Zn-dependent oxidoreductase